MKIYVWVMDGNIRLLHGNIAVAAEARTVFATLFLPA